MQFKPGALIDASVESNCVYIVRHGAVQVLKRSQEQCQFELRDVPAAMHSRAVARAERVKQRLIDEQTQALNQSVQSEKLRRTTSDSRKWTPNASLAHSALTDASTQSSASHSPAIEARRMQLGVRRRSVFVTVETEDFEAPTLAASQDRPHPACCYTRSFNRQSVSRPLQSLLCRRVWRRTASNTCNQPVSSDLGASRRVTQE